MGYLNSKRKLFLQYYLIHIDNKNIISKGNYEFDSDDSSRETIEYNYGLSWQFMNHNIYKIVLTCFYVNTYPREIASMSFKLKNHNIGKTENLTASYSDYTFTIQSDVSSDRKNSLLCYANNNERKGTCAVYNIDDNLFSKFAIYISNQCDIEVNRLSVKYFKETKEFIFSCIYNIPDIFIVKFDENFEIIEVDSEGNTKNETTLSVTDCYSSYFYSILFLSNNYTIIGDFICKTSQHLTTLYSIPDEYKPIEIYSDIIEISLNDDSDSELIFNCTGYKNTEGIICSETIPMGYYILDIINKILGKCHTSCQSCEKVPEKDSNHCFACKENFEINDNNIIFWVILSHSYTFNKKI